MTAKKLERELLKFEANAMKNWQDVVKAVNEYKAQNPDTTFDSVFPDGTIDRKLDGIALNIGWIKDRMDNKGFRARGGLSNKLRKALGYN